MIFLGLVHLWEQNVIRTFTAADHKQPPSTIIEIFKRVYTSGFALTGWVDWSASTVRLSAYTGLVDWLYWPELNDYSLKVGYQPT